MSSRRGLRWLIALVVLAVVLVAADRLTSAIAGRSAEHYLAKQSFFTSSPSVDIDGFPFLTQAAAGRYDDVEVRSSAVELDGVPAQNLRASLHGVHLSLGTAFGGSITSLPVDSVSGSVTFSYAELATLSKIPGLSLSDAGGQLRAVAKLTVPGVAGSVFVSGTATARIAANALILDVTDLSAAGLSISSTIAAQLATLFAAPIPIPALPYGLKVRSLTPASTGIVVSGTASNLVISPS